MIQALETINLGKRYGKDWALRGCTFKLPIGRVAGLVGPNGAGKTTLLHLAVGLLKPSAGSVQVFGEAPDRVLTRVGFVAQDRPLYRNFRVKDMLMLGQKLNPSWDMNLAKERLDRLAIPLNRPTGKLSGGQQAQVALVMALAKRPEMLILDEPIANLDPLARYEFQQTLMDAVAEDGLTVLFSSHLIADLDRICDYLIILSASQVQIASDIEPLLATHKRLIGPSDREASLARTHTILQVRSSERQSTLLVRLHGALLDPAWEVQEASLEDIILAYLALPAPFPFTIQHKGVQEAVR
ncbi:MAG TPA: ABC transporter ATP-binding protein [Ktedonobacteraceae bacterium]|jgi:ABC-2 type transport system ATP-binding protein|nr:ABC transporter ATP-binding protein [Ktedonobacteraceae bacterium]